MKALSLPRCLVAAALIAVLLGFPAAGQASAAEGGLRDQADATFRLDPTDRVVRVVIDWRITNQIPDVIRRTASGTVRQRSYTDGIILAVPSEAQSIVAVTGETRLRTSMRLRDGYRALTVRFTPLFYKGTRTIRVSFTLPAGPPRSSSDIRIGEAFATFTAWSWGDPGLSTVRIVLPKGFEEDGLGDTVTSKSEQDHVELNSGPIKKPDDWYHVVVASRPSEMSVSEIEPGGHPVVVRAWPEDVTWREKVLAVMDDGLPLLERMIGLPWTLEDELQVFEKHTPLLEGYAGVYDTAKSEITISEDLDEQTILHEASHVWFNGGLVEGRWITEGLAEYYADRAREELRLLEVGDPISTGPSAKSAFPLNEWPDRDRIDDAETDAQEAYGYNASYTVIRAIAQGIGENRLRYVLSAAWEQENAYVGDAPPKVMSEIPDWRHFLDLVQEVGGMEDADELFKRYVATSTQIKELEARERARIAYVELDRDGDDWGVPSGIRNTMDLWRFGAAMALMQAAAPVLDARDAAAESAEDLAIPVPEAYEMAFEEADSAVHLGRVATDLDAWASAAEDVSGARDAVTGPRTPLATLGLIGESPEASLETARGALGEADLASAMAAAAATTAMLAGAESVGTTRALIIGGVALAVLLLLILATALIVRRRRRRLALVAASASASTTLAASPEPEGARPEVPSTPS